MTYLTDFYDEYNLPQKNAAVTEAELVLIQNICPPPATVLDVGCGSGRHLIPLQEMGYAVCGIDSNPHMLSKLATNLPAVEIIETSIVEAVSDFSSQLGQRNFQLIISMWNSFNEYALDISAAQVALTNMRSHSAPRGTILINIEAAPFDPDKLNFTTQHVDAEHTFVLQSQLVSFDPQTQISTCQEQLTVTDKGNGVKKYTGELIQKWWTVSEITEIANQVGLRLQEVAHISPNQENYLLFTKD